MWTVECGRWKVGGRAESEPRSEPSSPSEGCCLLRARSAPLVAARRAAVLHNLPGCSYTHSACSNTSSPTFQSACTCSPSVPAMASALNSSAIHLIDSSAAAAATATSTSASTPTSTAAAAAPATTSAAAPISTAANLASVSSSSIASNVSAASSVSSLPVNIVGAGLAGCMAALLLAQQGYSIRLLEFRPDIRTSSTTYKDDVPGHLGRLVVSNKRSVNLALSHRGICALKAAGIFDRLEPSLIPMHGRVMHGVDGSLSYQPYGHDDQAIYSINRQELNALLLDELDKQPAVSMLFNTKVTAVNKEGDIVSQSGAVLPALFTIGADGAYSAVRESLRRVMRMDFSMHYISCGYKELHIPPTASGDYALPHPNGLHIWPRNDFMLIALPNPDKSFTCTLFAPFTGPDGLDHINTADEIMAYFKQYYADVIPLAPTLLDDYQSSPTSALLSVRCRPWTYKGKVLLLGDAAHAVVPFYGQGMNAGFEDCLLLSELLQQHDGRVSEALAAFEQQRVEAGHALADLSLANFVEMRSRTASWLFLLQKRVEKYINLALPRHWIPLYSMVAFTRIPYDECVRRGDRQETILRTLSGGLVMAGTAGLVGLGWWLMSGHGKLTVPAHLRSIKVR